MIKKFIKIFLIIDLAVVIFCLLNGNMTWLINTQLAFLGSLIITVGSFLGYQKNVKSRVTKETLKYNEADTIDKIEDQFDLYSEDDINYNEASEEEFKEIVKEEKNRVKQRSFKNMLLSFGGFSSVYRIIGYTVLIIGFFYLVNNKIFDTYSYLFGLFIVPFGSLVLNFTLSKK